MKIIAGFDTIITPRRSEGSSEGKFVLQRANKAKRGSHIPKEQWIATRFLSMDVSQSLRDEKLLPIQIVHFSYPLKHSRWRLAAVLTQYLFTAVDDGKFLTNRLPSFIQDFWRIASSDPIVVTASTETEGSILTFGEVSVSWAPGQSAEGKILRHMTFYGAALGQSFGLLLNMSDEDYKTLYFSEIVSNDPFVVG